MELLTHFLSSKMRIVLALSFAMITASLTFATVPDNASAASASTRIRVGATPWMLQGAAMPFHQYRCDFGCTTTRGVTQSRPIIDRYFRQLSRDGVKVVRWYVFSADAWQIGRRGSGMPTVIRRGVYTDMNVAVGLARKHDLYLDLVLFPNLDQVPATWVNDPAQRAQLATTLRPLFARYRGDRHVMGWELFSEAERGIDAGRYSLTDARDLAQRLTAQVSRSSHALTSINTVDASRIADWRNLGLTFFSTNAFTGMSGPACALCTTAAALQRQAATTRPIVIGATDAASVAAGTSRIEQARRRGFAGISFWSVRPTPHPDISDGRRPAVPHAATWKAIYAHADTGPRLRPLNPCIGPRARVYLCPNLHMGRITQLKLQRVGNRLRLLSRNSLDSIGEGPASIHGTRNGRMTMAAVQYLWTRAGHVAKIDTGARLEFKAIPGQYRYWKWAHAAQMELWRIDGTGRLAYRERIGPKTVYCLRDLIRTHGNLPRSPRNRYFPGCSQNFSQKQVTLGTSVGWTDAYPATYYENWIDVTGLRGCFAYVHIADPTNVIYESNEDDNRTLTIVRLPYTGSARGCPRASTTSLPETGQNGGY